MDTPGERLRKSAEEAERARAAQDTRSLEDEKNKAKRDLDLSQRAVSVGEAYLERAREILDQASRTVHLKLERHNVQRMDPGFWLGIGADPRRTRGVRATLSQTGVWRLEAHSATTDTRRVDADTDEGILKQRDAILEPLLTEAVLAAINREEVAPDPF